jgi:DNA modification methylase
VSVWKTDLEPTVEGHTTPKPISIVSRAIGNSSKSDDLILDIFGGSGSTLIACEQTNRTCYMMELDPKYCDVIRRRYQNFLDNSNKKE